MFYFRHIVVTSVQDHKATSSGYSSANELININEVLLTKGTLSVWGLEASPWHIQPEGDPAIDIPPLMVCLLHQA